MKTVRVCLDSIDKVKGFVNDISRFNTDFDLIPVVMSLMPSQLWASSALTFPNQSNSQSMRAMKLMKFSRLFSHTL